MNFNYVILYVTDIKKVRDFYTSAFDMSVVGDASNPDFVTLRPENGAMIGLQNKAAARMEPRFEEHAGTVELSFAVDDVDATWKHWQELGVDLMTEPMDLPFGRYFMARDPEGHYLSAYRFKQ